MSTLGIRTRMSTPGLRCHYTRTAEQLVVRFAALISSLGPCAQNDPMLYQAAQMSLVSLSRSVVLMQLAMKKDESDSCSSLITDIAMKVGAVSSYIKELLQIKFNVPVFLTDPIISREALDLEEELTRSLSDYRITHALFN